MQYEFEMSAPNTFDELNTLRLEAMDLFERCLTEQNPLRLETFIEQKLLQDPPPLQLLSELADDLHHRLLSLQQFHFDVRDHALKTLRADYGVHFSGALLGVFSDHYHLIDPDEGLRYLRQHCGLKAEHESAAHQLLKTSIETVNRVHQDILVAERLCKFVNDWLAGIQVVMTHRFWKPHHVPGFSHRLH